MATYVKHRLGASRGFFGVEAAGLRWLAVPDGVAIAEVIAVSDDSLSLVQVPTSPPSAAAARTFGTQLVTTHDAGATAFGVGPDGWSGDGYIGEAPLTLRAHRRWGEFYATERVLPYAREAAGQGTLTHSALGTIEALAERLVSGEFDDPAPPARIHGDLWAGNVLFGTDSVTLIDPAAQGGHRVTDLAMLALFGLPHLEAVFAAYTEASAQLPADWRALIGLHQLHPLLVHAVLFGGGYGDQAAQVACRY